MLDDQIEAALPAQIQGVPFKPLAKELNVDKQMWKGRRFDFQLLWNVRIKLLSILLEHKVKLLINDLDAVWLRIPTRKFSKNCRPTQTSSPSAHRSLFILGAISRQRLGSGAQPFAWVHISPTK